MNDGAKQSDCVQPRAPLIFGGPSASSYRKRLAQRIKQSLEEPGEADTGTTLAEVISVITEHMLT
jgi:hypothetical protein